MSEDFDKLATDFDGFHTNSDYFDFILERIKKENKITGDILQHIKILINTYYAVEIEKVIKNSELLKNDAKSREFLTLVKKLYNKINLIKNVGEVNKIDYDNDLKMITNLANEIKKEKVSPKLYNPFAIFVAVIFMLSVVIEIIFVIINLTICLIVVIKYGKSFKWYEYFMIPLPVVGTIYYIQYLF